MTVLKEFKLVLSKSAIIDIDNICQYIRESADSETALEVHDRIEEAVLSLRTLPKRQRVFFHRFRRLNAGSYAVIYVVDANTVTIRAVFHSSMDIVFRLADKTQEG